MTGPPSMPSLVSPDLQSKLLRAVERLKTERLWTYRPHPKQLEHHDKGAKYRQRLLMAGNQLGKSECGSAEVAMHATGIYPEWWKGARYDSLPLIWCGGVTALTTRDVIQEKLFGPHGSVGTGWIPKSRIESTTPSRGVPRAIDFALVKRTNGTTTKIVFKSFEQGREKWQAAPVPFIWLDEEPPVDVWTEALARTVACDGAIQMTFTPLNGMSEVVRQFYPTPNTRTKTVTRMGLKDALHIPPERHADILEQYPKHERDARLEGIPVLGSGAVFPIDPSEISVAPFAIPRQWPKIIGIDFGRGDHPTSAVLCAIDRENDTLYVVDTYRNEDPRIAIHADSIKRWGEVPVAWPKDGFSKEPTEGRKIADVYRSKGLKMMPEHAQYDEASMPLVQQRTNMVSVEAGLFEMLTYMQDGRFRVFDILHDWFEEMRMYHRVQGDIVKEVDDLMDATRYAFMSRRFARMRRSNASLVPVKVADYDPFEVGRGRALH